MFKLNNVSFCIESKFLLHSVSASFMRGKVYGLVGHNGSGKSTLLKLLAKQFPASSGKILLNDRLINLWKAREFAREVAYLPQYLPQNTQLTTEELILMSRFSHNGFFGFTKKSDKKIVDHVLKITDTVKFRHQIVDILSGGEKQRVWLAMCLAQQSRFLLLDEPISALDILHQIEIMELIYELAHKLNIGVIIVIHDINLAARYCDEIFGLKQGALCFSGTNSAFMNSQVLKEIYDVSLHVIQSQETGKWIAHL